MDGTQFIEAAIRQKRPVMIRLTEGKDIYAVPLAQDEDVLIVKRTNTEEKSMIYKKSISVIAPLGG